MLTVQFAVTCIVTATLTAIILVFSCNVKFFCILTQPPDKHQAGCSSDSGAVLKQKGTLTQIDTTCIKASGSTCYD